MKKRIWGAVLALAMVFTMPLGVSAKTVKKIDTWKERIAAEKITVGTNTIRLAVDNLTVTSITKVSMDDEELFPRHHYTAKKDTETGELVIVLASSFLQRQELGNHDIRMEFLEHSAETRIVIKETAGGVTATAPTTAGSSGSTITYSGTTPPTTGGSTGTATTYSGTTPPTTGENSSVRTDVGDNKADVINITGKDRNEPPTTSK